MKKTSLILIMILALLSLSSCDKVTKTGLAKQQAIDAVKEYHNSEKYLFEAEDGFIFDEKEYYRVHVYSLSEEMQGDDGQKYKQSFTVGWFYVDKIKGEVYIIKDKDQTLQLLSENPKETGMP